MEKRVGRERTSGEVSCGTSDDAGGEEEEEEAEVEESAELGACGKGTRVKKLCSDLR